MTVLDDPLIVSTPPEVVKLPALAFRSPATVMFAELVIVPEVVRLLNVNPFPEIDLLVPDMVSVPLLCVNEPEPVDARLPATVMALRELVTFVPETVRLLKLCVALPLMDVLAPAISTVLVLEV